MRSPYHNRPNPGLRGGAPLNVQAYQHQLAPLLTLARPWGQRAQVRRIAVFFIA